MRIDQAASVVDPQHRFGHLLTVVQIPNRHRHQFAPHRLDRCVIACGRRLCLQISFDRQVADLPHERVIAVVQLDIAASELTLVQGALGICRDLLRLEKHEGRASALAVLLLNVDVVSGDAAKTVEKVLNLTSLNAVWQTAHDQSPVLVVAADVVRQPSGLATEAAATAARAIEVQVVAIRDDTELNIACPNRCLIELFRRCRSLLRRFEQK